MPSLHTPGPWHADWDDNGYWYIMPLGITGSGLRGDSANCIESANAALIAQSPTMFELLKALTERLEHSHSSHANRWPSGTREADDQVIAEARRIISELEDGQCKS